MRSPSDVTPRLFTTREAARYLNVSPNYLRALVKHKRLKRVAIGPRLGPGLRRRKFLFDIMDLETFIQEGKHEDPDAEHCDRQRAGLR